MAINFVLMCFLGQNIFNLVGLRQEFNIASIVGSVVECSPATRAARVRFPDDANTFFCHVYAKTSKRTQRGFKKQKCAGDGGYRSPYLSHAKRALYHLSYVPMCTPCLILIVLYSELQSNFGTK